MEQNPVGPEFDKIITLWQMFIPLVVPIIILGIKVGIKKIPSSAVVWLAPALGAIIDGLLNLANLGYGFGAVGAVLGAAGIGVREILDQTKKRLMDRKTFKFETPPTKDLE